MATAAMRAAYSTPRNTLSHGDLHAELHESDKMNSVRRKQGLPSRYQKGRYLGKGGFAKCYEVQDMETREVFAAKIVAKASIVKPHAHAKLKSEIAIHRSMDHERIVKFYDYFEDSEYVYIILELCSQQTLNEFMRKRPGKRLSEAEAMFYLYDLIMALKYLRRRRVIHRDLKLGNLFLDSQMRIKVGDFGLAAQLEHDGEKKKTICGTPNYIAPEILEGKHGHSYEVDIWSLGVIVYTMVVGRPPFETSDVKTTYRRIRYNQYSFPENVSVSAQVKELVTSILRTDPQQRPGLDDILNSSWFQTQRIPPPMPTSLNCCIAGSQSPVPGSSARSETPERGGLDYGRVDSPAPGRFPLSDRSPSAVLANQVQNSHPTNLPRATCTGQQANVHSFVPPCKPSPIAPAYGMMTPGRQGLTQTHNGISGRPPLAHRGNEENLGPPNAMNGKLDTNTCSGSYAPANENQNQNQNFGGSYTPLSPTGSQVLLGGAANVAQAACRAQNSTSTPGGGSRLGLVHASGQQTQQGTVAQVRPNSGHLSSRDASPLRNHTGLASAPTAQVAPPKTTSGFNTARSSASSPRQLPTAAPISSVPSSRNTSSTGVPSVSTPKALRSSRTLGPSSSEGSNGIGGVGGGLFTKTTPALARSSRKYTAPESPSPWPADRDPRTPRTTGGSDKMIPSDFFGDHEVGRTPPSTAGCPQSRKMSECLSVGSVAGSTEGLHSARAGAAALDGPKSRSNVLAASGNGSSGRLPGSGSSMPEIWVTKWVDYSSKYGVGYILSDGSIGVYFNDSTKTVLSPDGVHFDYITRRTQDKPEIRSSYTFDSYPDEMRKKVTLLRHFKNYMTTDVLEQTEGVTVGDSSLPAPSSSKGCQNLMMENGQAQSRDVQAPYVKKWTRNRHAIMFQLSNKIVQVIFFDKTEAVLSSRSHMVTYVDKRGQVASYPLSSVLDAPSPELAKRLRYTKDILVNLLGPRNVDLPVPGTGPSSASPLSQRR
eukprot:gnl/TRDRNA2_/TRDRNA2_188009_c0_seq1.p1 gnl/TRDRNA2_/TRDRNA2_188009_c0~~gnl/TRDRNA2_/TRDRNA2_188009_c0_seq1.p1  ORF type:complete len:991 (+),score=135.87 gnl/TRDRNA2_/TRDRNA2_188009_c0_seq1:67-3039(+)